MTASMPKPLLPQPARSDPTPARVGRAVTCTRVLRDGNNSYRVIDEIYDCAPTSTLVILAGVSAVEAETEVRLRNERRLGVERFGESGLEPGPSE